jgi:hypothetical protein
MPCRWEWEDHPKTGTAEKLMSRRQLVALALLWTLLASAAFAEVPGPTCNPPPRPCSFDALVRMNWPELEQLYRQSEAGTIPHGLTLGRAIYPSGQTLSGPRAAVSRMVWRGKFFKDDCTMINQWRCCKATRARVYYGPSWLDCKPSIILDYQGMARFVWTDVRDEIREVAPGLYVGAMYHHKSPEKYEVLFVLEAVETQK